MITSIKNGGVNNFENIFNNWIDKKTKHQIEIIDEICEKSGVDANDWFKNYYLNRYQDEFSESDILDELLNYFAYYLEDKIQEQFIKYIEPDGYSIYNTPYLSDFSPDTIIKIKSDGSFKIKYNKKEYKNILKRLKLKEKEELLKNKLFFYMVEQTNLKIFSKKDIRYLKLRKLSDIK